jgi:cytochrome c oxidase assembly factor CtaG
MRSAIDIWLLVSAVMYARGWLRIRRRAPFAIPPWRAGMFILGLSTLWIAVASPLGAIAHERVSLHMVQHVLLGVVAPWLLWLGEPVRAFSIDWPQRWTPLGRFVAHPLTPCAGRVRVGAAVGGVA